MDFKEQQEQEIEALESIFSQEFQCKLFIVSILCEEFNLIKKLVSLFK